MRTKKMGTKFRKWLEKLIAESKLSNRDIAVMFGINDALVGHYRKSQRLPAYTTLQRIKSTLGDNVDMNDLFDGAWQEVWNEDKNMFSEDDLSKSEG